MRPIAFVFLIGALASASGSSLRAQDPPTFRTGTTLIEFTMVALDDEGKPITDLTKDDLVLTEGGRTRDIAFFRFDGEAPAGSPSRTVPPGFVTNDLEPERNAVAVVVDLLNVGAAGSYGQTAVRGLILHYLDSLPPNTYVGLFRFAETKPMDTLQPFTQRVDLLRSKVNSMQPALRLEFSSSDSMPNAFRGGASLGAMAEADARAMGGINHIIGSLRFSRTIEALEALGSHLAGISGRKSLIWITDAPPMQLSSTAANTRSLARHDIDRMSYAERIREAAQRLANQGIAVYPVSTGVRAERNDDTTEYGTFSVFARVTGGRDVINTNELTQGITVAAGDQRGTYTVGFYATDEPDDAWRPLKVDVRRAGVALRYRQGYLATRRAQPRNWPEKDWNDVVYQPLDSTEIHLNGKSEVVANKAALSLQVATRDLYFQARDGRMVADLEIGFVEKNRKGPTNVRVQPMEVSLDGAQVAQRPELASISTEWPVNAGTTAIRAIVRDRFTGRYGTLNVPFTRGRSE
jgi:VWFA-related protein